MIMNVHANQVRRSPLIQGQGKYTGGKMENKKLGLWKMHALKAVKFVILVANSVLFVMGCASFQGENQKPGSQTDFALVGDMPYDEKQEKQAALLMQAINAENLAFVIHDGDLWWDGKAWKETSLGLPPCADETFQDRVNLLQGFNHPLILVPGDNDWTDCYRAKPQAYDPMERLAKLRLMFFQGVQQFN